MYDISQLNDMLVPELQDIAIEQNISNAKRKRIIKPAVEAKNDMPQVDEEKVKPETRVKKSDVSVIDKKKIHKKEKEEEPNDDDDQRIKEQDSNEDSQNSPTS